MCFDFFIKDTLQPVHLIMQTEILDENNAPIINDLAISFDTNTDTLLQGMICWNANCDYTEQFVKIIVTGIDTFDCRTTNYVHDTIFVYINKPPNQTPTIQHFLMQNMVNSNTIYAYPGDHVCYQLEIYDPDAFTDLYVKTEGEIFDPAFGYGGNAVVTQSGTNPLRVEVCINPNCYTKNQNVTIEVCGVDSSSCAETLIVCDEVNLEIRGCKIEFPNVFTPNGDGYNDFFIP